MNYLASNKSIKKNTPEVTPDLWDINISFFPNAPTPRGTYILTMNNEIQLKILLTALDHGSHFEKKLAQAGIAADGFNRIKILKYFPELIEKFGPDSAIGGFISKQNRYLND
tara:strand:+ start:494 stop:829 length:336 start_codon:yes stop_codon:yes gene_type:complete